MHTAAITHSRPSGAIGQFVPSDLRTSNPRFMGGNLEHNRRLADQLAAIAAEIDAALAQAALAWLLAQGGFIAPIPGTTCVAQIKENTGADEIRLNNDQLSPGSAACPRGR
ncbi:aldo/keto reductase [Streptomyces sp. NPDC006173]|uniref:aldo/keto reductase n=1 Tax=Streptomyces sp. NPDC006173 TaxID=3155349 RepID=UPI0034103E1E